MSGNGTATPLVVVGIDGSECSRAALRFAVGEARLRGARLQVVSAWEVPAWAYAVGDTESLGPGEFRHEAEVAVEAAMDEARELEPQLDLTSSVAHGQPAATLLEAAGDADLLVVGSRGLGGFSRLLLGSVSEQLAHHAPCPVTIIRAPVAD
jgi:nucleotide-binding universal stress UspA family protein